MGSTRTRTNKEDVTFWLPDPADIERLMQLLEICGYTDESFAREEASQNGESDSVFEVTVRRREVVIPQQPWLEDVTWIDDTPETVWQA